LRIREAGSRETRTGDVKWNNSMEIVKFYLYYLAAYLLALRLYQLHPKLGTEFVRVPA
jgi:hypothetical protein